MVAMPGDTLMMQGEHGDRMFFLSSGKVEVVDQHDNVLHNGKPGDVFGELALLSDDPRAASVIAAGYCELQVLLKQDFEIVLENWPQLRPRMLELAAERISLAKHAAERQHLLDEVAAESDATVEELHEQQQASYTVRRTRRASMDLGSIISARKAAHRAEEAEQAAAREAVLAALPMEDRARVEAKEAERMAHEAKKSK